LKISNKFSQLKKLDSREKQSTKTPNNAN